MADHESLNEKHNQSNSKSDKSFEELLQKKLEAEQMIEEKFRKVMTLMQTDIKGSTEFQQIRGDIESTAILILHQRLLEPILLKYGGEVFSEETDGVFVAFENAPENAVKAAIEFMQIVHKHNESNRNKLEIRIAMHHGTVILRRKNQIKGLSVSTTARVEQHMKKVEKKNEKLFRSGLIFISGSLYDEVRNSEDIICRWADRTEAKGLVKPLDLYRVVWNLEQEQTIFRSTVSSMQTRGTDDSELKRTAIVPRKHSIFVVEIIKETDKIKISGYEKAEQERKTIHHYEEVKVDNSKIEEYIWKIKSLLNQATNRGKISKEILNSLKSSGKNLYEEMFNNTIKNKFATTSSEDLIINIDDNLVHIPWELLYDGTSFLCLRFNMGRIVKTRQVISEGVLRPMSVPLKMLVLSDPRNNLKSASKEGRNIKDKLESISSSIIINTKTGNIKSAYVMEKIRNFDIVHYAGHSSNDSANPLQNGWLLEDKCLDAEEIRELKGSHPMPALVFSNTCHSELTDKWTLSEDYENRIYGMAHSFLLAGVRHYIGTFWKILDDPGSHFAIMFYEHLSRGRPVGEAFRLARKDMIKKYGEETIIWASYMLYGDPSFCYVRPRSQQRKIPSETRGEERHAHTNSCRWI